VGKEDSVIVEIDEKDVLLRSVPETACKSTTGFEEPVKPARMTMVVAMRRK